MKKLCTMLALLFIVTINANAGEVQMAEKENAPISTQWVLDAVGPTGRVAVDSVYMMVCLKTSSKGSGFLVDNGIIVTNEHVVRGCSASEIFALSSYGDRVEFSELKLDTGRDLAALTPKNKLRGGLPLRKDSNLDVGSLVRTWGFPLGYNGPAPLLSVGYLSGFTAHNGNSTKPVKHLVVNGAFNSGNSGGPLFVGHDKEVIGVVVNKVLPIFTPFIQSAIKAFANNQSGVVFTGTDANGKQISLVESQLVAEVVASLHDMAQVMIGEAIAVEELASFIGYKYNN